ncbi:MAG TPA: hypothetical protein VKV37_19135 [Ktedonobacteraceae bacterium]|jgi:hypothetical protein|nr:hypothetical protein [Ktedonobacteraceae bacterium]
MLDQMQVSPVVSPLVQEEPTTFISPMPEQVVLGHTTLTNDCEEFLHGINGGIMAYCEIDYERTEMTAQELMKDLAETLQDKSTSLTWCLGFITGQIAGLLNPDIADTKEPQSCVEVLSRKCQALYPGPDHIS